MALRRRNGSPARLVEPLPRVIVHPGAMQSVAATAGDAGDVETGGPLFGTVHRSWENGCLVRVPTVLGTVSPVTGPRSGKTWVSLGCGSDAERTASALRWLRSATGLDLVHLGDWHTHPSGVLRPSAGDRKTAEQMRAASAEHTWLVGIAVPETPSAQRVEGLVEAVRIERKSLTLLHLSFFDAFAGFPPVPVVVEADALPRLPPLPWHVTNPGRFAAECRLLAAAGFTTSVATKQVGTGLHLRLERGGKQVLAFTASDHPLRKPELRGPSGRRVDRPDWSPDRFLVDLADEACR